MSKKARQSVIAGALAAAFLLLPITAASSTQGGGPGEWPRTGLSSTYNSKNR